MKPQIRRRGLWYPVFSCATFIVPFQLFNLLSTWTLCWYTCEIRISLFLGGLPFISLCLLSSPAWWDLFMEKIMLTAVWKNQQVFHFHLLGSPTHPLPTISRATALGQALLVSSSLNDWQLALCGLPASSQPPLLPVASKAASVLQIVS